MATWKNLDTLETFKALSEVKRVKLAEVMSGAEGAERVKKYSVPMAEGFSYNFAAKQVDWMLVFLMPSANFVSGSQPSSL